MPDTPHGHATSEPGPDPALGSREDVEIAAAGVGAPTAPATVSEVTWVTRAQDGDVAAFEQLVDAYQADLFRLAYRMLFDRGAAEDAVQETFVAVWRRLPSLVDPLAFRAWIFHIASRRCLNVLRVRDRQRTGVTHGPDFEAETQSRSSSTGGDDPAAVVQTRATRRGLDEVLATLPSEQRVCWVLHELHELPYAAIAYAIGVPLSTVRGRISRARQNLANGMSSWR